MLAQIIGGIRQHEYESSARLAVADALSFPAHTALDKTLDNQSRGWID